MQLLLFKSMALTPNCRICGLLKCVSFLHTQPLKMHTYKHIHTCIPCPHSVEMPWLPMARALLTSLLQEQFMGCSVKWNSNPWACGTAPVITYLTHTLMWLSPQHTHSLIVFTQTIKSLRQMKAGNSVFVLFFCPSQISITKSCHESGRARAY